MGLPPQFPPADRPESNDPGEQNSGLSEFLHAEPSPEELIQQDLFRAEAFAADDRRRFLRRLGWLLVAGLASFALVSWMLVRSTRIIGFGARDSEPIAVVKLELGSLARGDMQDAYAQLSERYRKEVPFANYNALVTSHRRMFLTREYRVTRDEVHDGQLQIDAQIVSVNGRHYLARFTLVEIAGRWWIDDLHWRAETYARMEHT
ncbi:MAG TPA: hypothetical protein VIH72_00055 [Candidatus Acidoferrales bacterium]